MVIDNSGNIIGRPFITGKPQITGNPADIARKRQEAVSGGFESILRQKQAESRELKFSRHAEERLRMRNIQLTQEQKDRMREAVEKAESKGVRDSLVLMDGMAFVVSVKNRTVITAANSNELKENVFTNIDGAVII